MSSPCEKVELPSFHINGFISVSRSDGFFFDTFPSLAGRRCCWFPELRRQLLDRGALNCEHQVMAQQDAPLESRLRTCLSGLKNFVKELLFKTRKIRTGKALNF